ADARIVEYGGEPRDGSRLEHRVRIDGQEEITLREPRRGVHRRAAAAARAMADDHVDEAHRARPLRDGAGIVGRSVIYDDDFDWAQCFPAQRGDRGGEAGGAVEGRDDDADRGVACEDSVSSSADA